MEIWTRYSVGIDYSMNSPAVCVMKTDYKDFYNDCQLFYLGSSESTPLHNVHRYKKHDWKTNEDRFNFLKIFVMKCLNLYPNEIEKVYLEGYSYGSTGRTTFEIGENTGVLKHYLWHSGYEINVTSPTSIKKYFTGKGNAKKEDMYESFIDNSGAPADFRTVISPKHSKIDSPVFRPR